MGQVKDTAPTFAEWLRDQLDARGWGVRTLARHIDPADMEVPRRALNRYMRGARPTEPYIVAIAKAFGIARATIPIEEVAPAGDTFRGGAGADVVAGDRRTRGASARGKGDLAA